jgi:hypothetical protein
LFFAATARIKNHTKHGDLFRRALPVLFRRALPCANDVAPYWGLQGDGNDDGAARLREKQRPIRLELTINH